MSALNMVCLLLVPALLSAGQVLFKNTAGTVSAPSLPGFIGALLASPSFWAALVIYGVATLLWVYVLIQVPLSRAIPFIALTFVLVPVLSAVFFGERLTLLYGVGIAVIITGVTIAASAQG